MKTKFNWQDVLLTLILVIYLFYQITLLLNLKQVPSPIYGGDYWFSHGAIQHFVSGGNIFGGTNILGSEPGYLPLYTLLAGIPAIISGISVFSSMKIFSIILTIIAIVLFYYFAQYLFKNKSAALLTTILYLPLTTFPIWKYRQFTGVLMIPLLLFAALYFYKERNLKSAIFAGITLGLMGLSHTAGFLASAALFAIISLDILIIEHLDLKKELLSIKNSFREKAGRYFLLLMLIAILGFLIAMPYYFKPLFVHHFVMPESSLYAVDFSTFQLQMSYILTTLKDNFLDFQSLFHGARSIMFILGVLTIFFLKKYDEEKRFLAILLITAFAASFHQLITIPLFGVSFSPIIISTLIFPITAALFAGLFLDTSSSWLGKFKIPVAVTILAFLIVTSAININNSLDDQWIKLGMEPLPDHLKSLQNFILQNTDVNDVFLSSNELGFSLNALTGRKLLITRRAQNSPFLSMDDRQMAAAIILYGNDDYKRVELLRQYNVKYLYWNYYWLQSDFTFDEQGQLIRWFDPIIVRDNPERTAELARYNITTMKQYTWIDPTVHEPLSKENLIIIGPYQWSFIQPWNPKLENHLNEVWTYNDANTGQVLSRIYEVKI